MLDGLDFLSGIQRDKTFPELLLTVGFQLGFTLLYAIILFTKLYAVSNIQSANHLLSHLLYFILYSQLPACHYLHCILYVTILSTRDLSL